MGRIEAGGWELHRYVIFHWTTPPDPRHRYLRHLPNLAFHDRLFTESLDMSTSAPHGSRKSNIPFYVWQDRRQVLIASFDPHASLILSSHGSSFCLTCSIWSFIGELSTFRCQSSKIFTHDSKVYQHLCAL